MATIHSADSLKMIRETLCLAESALIERANRGLDAEAIHASHLKHIANLIADIDRQRPLHADGTHGSFLAAA